MALKLSNEALALIARHLQVAILTGTDIVDNLRLLDLEVREDILVPTQTSLDAHEAQVKAMLDLVDMGFQGGENQIVS